MGFNQLFTTEVTAALLAGFGIWTKPKVAANQDSPANISPNSSIAPRQVRQTSHHVRQIYPLHVTRLRESNPQLAGRMVISGRMADVCAELDRLAA